eukprot:CAMPEP_0177658082 /NCGR_PEP_ID=MMETSP0447-20121125/16601_1 /TAXON_ID=0 /ORGANISM="Stygamoeba regulata, Strain BSH-02190019" /LENGTH=323 /DNA_ID=CAMNT_0019162625 /DNA_START=66 /DNA_END=1037 /DNA_ORIENTATION=-
MTTRVGVSVILPLVDELRHEYLDQILENLASQEPPAPGYSLEVIAVCTPAQQSESKDQRRITASTSTSSVLTAGGRVAGDYLRTDPTIRRVHEHRVVTHTVVCSARNRAQRLNIGIAHASGEVLVLHHPATLLPARFALRDVFQCVTGTLAASSSASSSPSFSSSLSSSASSSFSSQLEQSPTATARWGCFRHTFDHDHWLLRFTSWYSNWMRVPRYRITYFDHCPFADRLALLDVPVPELDIFEDTAWSREMNHRYGAPRLLDTHCVTSARRFLAAGVYWHSLRNQLLKIGYSLGLPPAILNILYESREQINVKYPRDRDGL